MLADGAEIAFLDVREPVDFGSGHAFLAVNIPRGRMELELTQRVPRPTTRMVLCDGGGGDEDADRAAARLAELGYDNVSVLDGGAAAWAAAGHELFTDIEVPVKAFTAFAEHHGGAAFITPADLKARLDRGAPTVVLDARPGPEYASGHVPGAYDAPGPDVLRSVADLAPDPETLVVVNCMSRTRGILGSLGLRKSDVPNPVVALLDGTHGWRLAGYALEKGPGKTAPPPSASGLAAAQRRAAILAGRAGVPRIDHAALARWRADAGRTVYVIDLRDAQAYAQGHLAGSISAPAGNAIMTPDRFAATMNARVVLVDDDGVRAPVTAFWWHQFGWYEVALLDAPFVGQTLETGAAKPAVLGIGQARPKPVSAADAAGALARGEAALIDLSSRDAYRAGHPVGSAWALRSRLVAAVQALQPPPAAVILTSDDGVLARLAAAELETAGVSVAVIDGGNGAWRAAGLAEEAGDGEQLSPPVDRWLRSAERPGDPEANIRAYLAWETSLLEQVERDGGAPYRSCLD